MTRCDRECWHCAYGDSGCLAGHEQPERKPATESQLMWRLQDKRWKRDRQKIVKELEEIQACKRRT